MSECVSTQFIVWRGEIGSHLFTDKNAYLTQHQPELTAGEPRQEKDVPVCCAKVNLYKQDRIWVKTKRKK